MDLNQPPIVEQQPPQVHAHAHAPPEGNNQFGVMRDRLFHAMVVRAAIAYSVAIRPIYRTLIEFVVLLLALSSLGVLLFVHLMFTRVEPTCLDHVVDVWPQDGILRVDVIRNLKTLEYKEQMMSEWREDLRREQNGVCRFSPADVLRLGPKAIPAEIRHRRSRTSPVPVPAAAAAVAEEEEGEEEEEESELRRYIRDYLFQPIVKMGSHHNSGASLQDLREEYAGGEKEGGKGVIIGQKVVGEGEEEQEEEELDHEFDEFAYLRELEKELDAKIDPALLPRYEYRAEYSFHYGALRLGQAFREKHNISVMTVRIDSESSCFGDSFTRRVMRTAFGFEDSVMASLRRLASNRTDIGYMHDLGSNEHYHFVALQMSKTSYLTALLVMFMFTFAISMLLRFSHHQIFVFIVDLLHMFELNQPLVFPAAPLLTVILALVGMEAIMSEVFSDTSTAFYVILVVWVADQFDAICCHSAIGKRHWLRFFYLYQFFFYAYQYRFGALYGTYALFSSTCFILHSMIFFFHHYEMPLILYQDRLQRILTDIQHNPPAQAANNGEASLDVLHIRDASSIRRNAAAPDPNSEAADMAGEDIAVDGRDGREFVHGDVVSGSASAVLPSPAHSSVSLSVRDERVALEQASRTIADQIVTDSLNELEVNPNQED